MNNSTDYLSPALLVFTNEVFFQYLISLLSVFVVFFVAYKIWKIIPTFFFFSEHFSFYFFDRCFFIMCITREIEFFANLMHSSGYASQSMIHLNRCQDIQPIGGVRATPLSSDVHVFHKEMIFMLSDTTIVMQMNPFMFRSTERNILKKKKNDYILFRVNFFVYKVIDINWVWSWWPVFIAKCYV